MWICIGIAILAALILKSKQLERKRNLQYQKQKQEEWGTIPTSIYTQEKWNAVERFFRSREKEGLDLDDITWHDLDMNRIYSYLNNTESAVGEEYLYYLLRHLEFEPDTLKKRKELMDYFRNEEKERIQIQSLLHSMGKFKDISIYEYINRAKQLEQKSNLPHIFMAGGLLCSIFCSFLYPVVFVPMSLLFMILNMWSYYKEKSRIHSYLRVFSYITQMLHCAKKLGGKTYSGISEESKRLLAIQQNFISFMRGAFLVSGGTSMQGSLLDSLFDYVRMLFHVDLIQFNRMLYQIKEKQGVLNEMFEIFGKIDSMIGAASFLDSLPYFCIPELKSSSSPYLQVDGLYHPSVKEPVANSISTDTGILLTGSNASGKSTFIKALAINGILSQTIYTSLSHSYQSSYFRILSSMALADNLLGNESYYIVEIKSLKRILSLPHGPAPILCFIDEVLRGTNTLERIAASSEILLALHRSNTLCFAATHDWELAKILPPVYQNYHFQEHVEQNQVLFDYKLYRGPAASKNAIKLLRMIGYSEEIIDGAEQRIEEFNQNGYWKGSN